VLVKYPIRVGALVGAAVVTACSGGGGALPSDLSFDGSVGDLAVFGGRCTSLRRPCAPGLSCFATRANSTEGFCTRGCEPPLSSCAGAPTGTEASCLLQAPNDAGLDAFLCGFVCEVPGDGGGRWSCPGALRCAEPDDPPDSGYHHCIQ
jgi:hypothetical protein